MSNRAKARIAVAVVVVTYPLWVFPVLLYILGKLTYVGFIRPVTDRIETRLNARLCG